MFTHRTLVRITWGDCDPAGIVYFPRYFSMFNEATCQIFECVGLKKPLLLKTYQILGFPVVDVSASFSQPCTFGDDVVIETAITQWGRTSFTVRHRLLKDNVLAVEGHEKRVWVVSDAASPGGIRAHTIPDELKERFIRLAASPASSSVNADLA